MDLVSCDHRAPWLSSLPTRWSNKPLKYLAAINRMALPESTPQDQTIRYIDISSVNSLGEVVNIEAMPFGNAPSRARRVARHGDTIVSTVRTYLRAVASIPEDDTDLIASTGFAVVTPGPDLHPGFLSHWLRGNLFVDEVCARSVGVSYPATNASEVGCIPVPVPPLPIQRAIADFLDRKTAAIDALIEKKQKLLDLLTEKRAALINQAVTKGLDPNVPMKDSGIPWIGEIPAHWEVKRLKHISPRQTVGVVVNPSSYVEDAGEVPFIYGSEVSEGRIDAADARRISHESNGKLSKSQLRAGDLVCVRVGDPGVTAVVPPELDGMNCGSIMIVRQAPTFDSDWLCYAMNSKAGRQNVWLVAYGAAQKQYNIGHAVDFVYPVPPLHEQSRIASMLTSAEARFRLVTDILREQQLRLQEYRQALITAAVTGQFEIAQEDAG